jgi:hypothetical protein
MLAVVVVVHQQQEQQELAVLVVVEMLEHTQILQMALMEPQTQVEAVAVVEMGLAY